MGNRVSSFINKKLPLLVAPVLRLFVRQHSYHTTGPQRQYRSLLYHSWAKNSEVYHILGDLRAIYFFLLLFFPCSFLLTNSLSFCPIKKPQYLVFWHVSVSNSVCWQLFRNLLGIAKVQKVRFALFLVCGTTDSEPLVEGLDHLRMFSRSRDRQWQTQKALGARQLVGYREEYYRRRFVISKSRTIFWCREQAGSSLPRSINCLAQSSRNQVNMIRYIPNDRSFTVRRENKQPPPPKKTYEWAQRNAYVSRIALYYISDNSLNLLIGVRVQKNGGKYCRSLDVSIT